MAQEQDNEILLTIKVSEDQVKEKVLGARAALVQLNKELAATRKEYKDNTISAEEFAKSEQAIATQIAKAKAEIKEGTKVLEGYSKSTKAAEGSLDQMRAKVALIAPVVAKLSKEERENSESGQQLVRTLGELTEELKQAEQLYGVFSRDVGNYGKFAKQAEVATDALADSLKEQQDETESLRKRIVELIASTEKEAAAFDKAGSSIDSISVNIAKLEDEYNGLSKAQRDNEQVGGALLKQIKSLEDQQERNRKATDRAKKSVKDYIKDIDVLGINVGRTVESFKSGGQGVLTFAKNIVSARGALVALTAVPIVLVLTALVSFFTKSKEGSELLTRKLAGLTAVLDLVFGKAIDFGKAIVDAFTNPVDALKKLGEAISQNLSNRLAAVGEIVSAIAKLDVKAAINGFLQLLTGVTNVTGKVEDFANQAAAAAAAGEKVALEAQKIADAERKLNVERAKSQAQIEQLKKTSDDVTQSQKVRENAARAAYALENGLLQQQLKLQQRKVNNIKADNALRKESVDGLNKLSDAESELANIKKDSLEKQTELNNKLNELQLEGAKKRAELEVANAERALELAKEKGEKNALELFELEKDLLDKRLKLSLVGVIKGSEEEKAIMAKYRTDLTNLNIAATISEQQREDAIQKAYLLKRLAQAKVGSEEEFNIRRGLIQIEYLEQVHAAQATIKNKQELNTKLQELDAKYLQEKELLEQQYRQVQLAKEEALIESRLSKVRRGSDKEYKLFKEQRANALKKELDDVTKTEEQKQAIRDKYRRADEDAEKDHAIRIFDQVVEGLTGITDSLNQFIDASVTRQINALDDQQEAILNSAALSADARTKIEEDFAKKREKIEKEAAEKRRKIASIENIINTASAVTRAFVDPGGLFGAIFAGIALAKGIAQQVIIDNQKFATGGVYRSDRRGAFIQGPGTGTSDSINARISNGESILTARATQMFYPQLSAMNVAGGGRPFPNAPKFNSVLAVSKYSSPLPNAQYATPGFAYGGFNGGLDTNAIAVAIARGMRDVTIIADVKDINAAQTEYNRVQASGDFGYKKRR